MGIPLSDAVSSMTFQVAMFHNNFVFCGDFPANKASYFVTNGISVTLKYKFVCEQIKQVAQLSQRDRAAGWVSYG